MDYIMLVTDDKEIISTHRIPIFNGEQNSDNLKILFPLSVEDTSPTLQVILPDGKTGKIMHCKFEDEIYKNRLVCNVPISKELTAYSGTIQIWFTFFGNTQESTTKTHIGTVDVLEHKGFSSIKPDNDVDVVESITELQNTVNMLKIQKGDSITIDENNALCLQANGETIAKVDLPDDVTWELIE